MISWFAGLCTAMQHNIQWCPPTALNVGCWGEVQKWMQIKKKSHSKKETLQNFRLFLCQKKTKFWCHKSKELLFNSNFKISNCDFLHIKSGLLILGLPNYEIGCDHSIVRGWIDLLMNFCCKQSTHKLMKYPTEIDLSFTYKSIYWILLLLSQFYIKIWIQSSFNFQC